MSQLDDDVWNTVADAGGASPAQLRAAEQLLGRLDAEPLPPPRVDELVAAAVAARTAADARTRAATPWALPVALLATVAFGLLAAVGPSWLWPERSASVLTMDCGAAVIQAMTDSDDAARFRAVAVLEERVWQSLDVLQALAQDQDPALAIVASHSLAQLRSSMLGPTAIGAPEGDLDGHCAIATDPGQSSVERSLALIQVGRWAAQTAHALRGAPLLDARHQDIRAVWLRELTDALAH